MTYCGEGRVFVVIPTFNRLRYTKECLGFLAKQSWPHLYPIVSDGGSTDGTREVIRREYPNVALVFDDEERWWAGSTALGVARALEHGRDGDFVLLLNNDTEIPPDYVATLVAVSRRERAAVGAKIVDSRDHTLILDAGEYIDWKRYDFPVRTEIRAGETFCDEVDVLPGRGSLIPLEMIRSVGNVDDKAFPHYLADYDLFCRIKAAGHRLAVSYETAIFAHIEETGITPSDKRTGFRQVYRELFSRRSMTNIGDHLRFAARHAPPEMRAAVRLLIVKRALQRLLFGTKLACVTIPLLDAYLGARSTAAICYRIWRERNCPDSRFLALQLPGPLAKLAQIVILPRPMSASEIQELGFDVKSLTAQGLIGSSNASHWYRVLVVDPNNAPDSEVAATLTNASTPLSVRKIARLRAYYADKSSPRTAKRN